MQEPQSLGVLRAAGWQAPPDIPDTEVIRVYQTRLEPTWLQGILPELRLGLENTVLVGGDFVLPPHVDDKVALQPGRLQRWGPSGTAPYHILVPPRPHLETWLRRIRQQVPLEAAGTWVTMAIVVPRDRCPLSWDVAALRRAVPQAAVLFDDPSLEIRVAAVGARPVILRVPADSMVLPPPSWEPGLLPRDRVMLFLSVRMLQGDRMALTCRWLRDTPPHPLKGRIWSCCGWNLFCHRPLRRRRGSGP